MLLAYLARCDSRKINLDTKNVKLWLDFRKTRRILIDFYMKFRMISKCNAICFEDR